MKNNNYAGIDIRLLISALLHRAWLIVLLGILCACIAFSYATYMITPLYKSSVRLYVNNNSISLSGANVSINASDLSVAKSLVDIYIIILDSKPALMEIIDEAGLNYSHRQLRGMLSARSVNGTEVFEVTVTSPDPEEAAKIANCVIDVLPDRVSDVIDGSSVRMVDYAEVATAKSSPDVTGYTKNGFIVGVLIAALIIVVMELRDDVIYSTDYLTDNFTDIPLLASIPDLTRAASDKYAKYSNAYEYKAKNGGEDD